jgi:hypothetical protein
MLSDGCGEKEMSLSYTLFLIIAVGIFFAAFKMPMGWRIGLSIGIFALLCGILTALWIIGGDPASKGARKVSQEELNKAANP